MLSRNIFQHLSIRRLIVVFFLAFIFIILLPVVLAGRLWFLNVVEQTENQILTRSYRSTILYFDSSKNLLMNQVAYFAESPQLKGLFSDSQDKGKASQFLKSFKKKSGLDCVAVLDVKGRTLTSRELGGGDFLGNRIFSEMALRESISNKDISAGFWHDQNGRLWLLAAYFISADVLGQRKTGTLVVGFLMDNRINTELEKLEDIQVDIFHPDISQVMGEDNEIILPASVQDSWKTLVAGQKDFLIKKDIQGNVNGVHCLDALIRDIEGNVFGIMRIWQAGRNSLYLTEYIIIFVWCFLFFLALSVLWSIKFVTKNVIAPLLQLTSAIRGIASSKDLSKRLKVWSDDEIGSLIREFNLMMEELELSQKKGKHSSEELAMLYRDLLDQKKFTSEILATAPSLILVLLPDGRVKFINEMCEAILGYKSEEIVGRNWFDYFIPFAQRAEIKSIFDDILKNNLLPYRQHENIILAKDGTEKIILWHNSILLNRDNKISAVISIGQDKTDEKKIAEKLAQRIKDLDRFFKVTMDREHIIINLKQEIKELKEKLK